MVLIVLTVLLTLPWKLQTYMEPTNHSFEHKHPVNKTCEGPLCTIPFPRLCANPKVKCAYMLKADMSVACVPVLALPCACPPPLKTFYGDSLECYHKTKQFPIIPTTQYALLIGDKLGTTLDPTDVVEAYNWGENRTKNESCVCPTYYKWSEWEPWSQWTNLCTFNATRYRHRSRGCSESKNPMEFATAHYCETQRNGDPINDRTQVEKAPTTDCPLRSQFLDARKAQRTTWSEYLLLSISILLLLLIIVTVVLILKKVNL